MPNATLARLSAALTSLVLGFTANDVANAMPVGIPAQIGMAVQSPVVDVRYRRTHRRRADNGGAAVLGLFGAVLGGVIANQRYNDYSDYNYGQRYNYGYSPNYVYGPSYGGGWRRGGGYYGRGYYGPGGGYPY